MALSRPVAIQVWNQSTSTGVSGSGGTDTGIGDIAFFGIPVTRVSALISNTATGGITATIQATVGGSTGWSTIHTFGASESSGSQIVNSTADFVVDKARLNISANTSTGLLRVWLAGA